MTGNLLIMMLLTHSRNAQYSYVTGSCFQSKCGYWELQQDNACLFYALFQRFSKCGSPRGVPLVLWEGSSLLYEGYIYFKLNTVQDKIYIFLGTLRG
jgi:hypothetical protein